MAYFDTQRAVMLGATATGAWYYLYQNTDDMTKFQIVSNFGPLLRMLDPETTHNMGIWGAKWGLFPKESRPDPPILHTQVWNREFPNPVGLAAGFDKDGEIIEHTMGLGFGFVEIGSVTPKPQPGNAKPRAFRIPELKALINRYGFNSLGADAVQDNLEAFYRKALKDPSMKKGPLGVNFGKNKQSKDAAQDYSIGLSKLAKYADYLVINVSSPNTPGLRSLQGRKELEELVKQVKGTRDRMTWGRSGPPPLLVKIAPDLTDADKADIAHVILKHGVDGLIVSNTTISRPEEVAKYPQATESGGLSGPPLFELSTQTLRDMFCLTGGKVPIIGCGGVSNGTDAYKKIRAGASLVQLYTGLAYEGPVIVPKIKQELAACLERDGFNNITEAVGADHPKEVKQAKKGWISWLW